MPGLKRISEKDARNNIIAMAGREKETDFEEKLKALVQFFGIGMSDEEFESFSEQAMDLDNPGTTDLQFIAQYANMNVILANEDQFRKFATAYKDDSISNEEYQGMQMFVGKKLLEAAGMKAEPENNERLDEVIDDLDQTAKKEDPVFYEQAVKGNDNRLNEPEKSNDNNRYMVDPSDEDKDEVEKANERLAAVMEDLNITALREEGLVNDHENSIDEAVAILESEKTEYTFKPFFDEDYDLDADARIEECKGKVAAVNPKDVFGPDSKKAACDYVIAKMLKKDSAKTTFYERYTEVFADDFDVEGANKQIDLMRDKMMKDPVFDSVISRNLTAKEFYGEYMKAVNADINRRIRVEKNRNKQLAADASLADKQQTYLENNYIELSDEEANSIRAIRGNIKKFNKGKKPSKLMENLMESFDIADANRKYERYNMADIDELNKAALAYYETRQGKITGPITENGKNRLAEVEKLIEVTGAIMVKIRSAKEMKMPKSENKTENKKAMTK